MAESEHGLQFASNERQPEFAQTAEFRFELDAIMQNRLSDPIAFKDVVVNPGFEWA
jgi:hypothetical protein